jgi:glycosyltransferase involved in cell wall biosynthesis
MAVPLPQTLRLPWSSFRFCDRVLVSLEAEKQILVRSYGVHPTSVRKIPLGLKESFLKAGPGPRTGDYLISHGTIAPVKNSVELARLAREAQIPVLFVGKPFAEGDSYWEQFRQLVDNKYVRHQPHVASEVEMINLIQCARGFVLKSRFENWSLAAHEAVACGLPLLLPDLPWARERFGSQASFFPRKGTTEAAAALRNFYQQSPNIPPPKVRLYNWREVAELLRDAYTGDAQTDPAPT